MIHAIHLRSLRGKENTHILLWLLKDVSWVMGFKLLGCIMILPTMLLAYYIAWITKPRLFLFLPNLAVCCWITANVIWMLGEFFEFDFQIYALFLFLNGLCIMGYYYLRMNWLEMKPSKKA
jgi:hypothetical protein